MLSLAQPRRSRVPVIRPEWLRFSIRPLDEAKPLEVALVEPLGAEILVHARWSGGDLVARAPADFAAPERCSNSAAIQGEPYSSPTASIRRK